MVSINTGNGIKLLDLSGLRTVKKLYEGSEKAKDEQKTIKSLAFDAKIIGNLGSFFKVVADTIILTKVDNSDWNEYVLVVHLERKNFPFGFNQEACAYAGQGVSFADNNCDNCEYKRFSLNAKILDSDGLIINNSGAYNGAEDLLTRCAEYGKQKKILFSLMLYDTQKDANDIIKKMSHLYIEGAHD